MGSCITQVNVPTQSQVKLAEQIARRMEIMESIKASDVPLDPQNDWFKDYQKVDQPAWVSDYFELLAAHLPYPHSTDANTAFLAISDKLKRLFESRDSETSILWENSQGEEVSRVPTNDDIEDELSHALDKITDVLQLTSDVYESTFDLEQATLIEALTLIQITIQSNKLVDPRVQDDPWNVAERCVVKNLAASYNVLTDTDAFDAFITHHKDELDKENAFNCTDADYDANLSDLFNDATLSSDIGDDEWIYRSFDETETMDYSDRGLGLIVGDVSHGEMGDLLYGDVYGDVYENELLSLIDGDEDHAVVHHRSSAMNGSVIGSGAGAYEPYGLETDLSWSVLLPILTHVGVAGCVLGVVMFCLTCCVVPCAIWVGYRCFLKGMGRERTKWMKKMILDDIETARRRTRDALLRDDDDEKEAKEAVTHRVDHP
eukprot:407944_1